VGGGRVRAPEQTFAPGRAQAAMATFAGQKGDRKECWAWWYRPVRAAALDADGKGGENRASVSWTEGQISKAEAFGPGPSQLAGQCGLDSGHPVGRLHPHRTFLVASPGLNPGNHCMSKYGG